MASIHQAGVGNIKDIVRSAIIWGMIAVLPLGVTTDAIRNGYLTGAAQNLSLANFWIYAAITSIGGILAWSTPKSLSAWQGARNVSVLIQLVLIGTATYQVLIKLVNNNLQGAIVNFGLFSISIGIFAIVSAWKQQSRKI
jgi:hypothetical protein